MDHHDEIIHISLSSSISLQLVEKAPIVAIVTVTNGIDGCRCCRCCCCCCCPLIPEQIVDIVILIFCKLGCCIVRDRSDDVAAQLDLTVAEGERKDT